MAKKGQPVPARLFVSLQKMAKETNERSQHFLAFYLEREIQNQYVIQQLTMLHALTHKLCEIFELYLCDDEEMLTVPSQEVLIVASGIKEIAAVHEELSKCGISFNLN